MSSPATNSGQLVLILCTERSGSTLLSVMLGGHPKVLAPPELHLLRYPTLSEWRTGSPKAQASLDWLLTELGTGTDDPLVHQHPRPLYEWVLERLGPEGILVDKSPAYTRSPEALALAETFTPRYLWLVRHPLGVAGSRIERLHSTHRKHDGGLRSRVRSLIWRLRDRIDARTGRDARRQVEFWVRSHQGIREFLATIPQDRQHRVHFEDLVRAPEAELQKICTALALDLHPAMLAPTQHTPSALKWGVGDEKLRQHKGIDPSIASRWKDAYSERTLSTAALELMDQLGVQRSP